MSDGLLELKEIFERSVRDRKVISKTGPLEWNSIQARILDLKSLSILENEGVGISFENGVPCIETYIALAFLGAVTIPLPSTLPIDEKHRLWRLIGCRYFLSEKGHDRLLPDDSIVQWPKEVRWVLHSSGSTNTPKPIALTFGAVKKNSQDLMQLLDPLFHNQSPIHLGAMSQCYTSGLYNSFLLPLLTGGKALLGPIASALKINQWLELVRTFQPEILWINPTVLSLLVKKSSAVELKGVKAAVVCTAPLDQKACIEAEDLLRIPVLQSYGLTETLIVSLEQPGRNPRTQFSAGNILGGNKTVSLEEDHIISIHNGAVSPGYAHLKDGKLQLDFLDRGKSGIMFMSGDLGSLDKTGRLTITGRISQMINVEGVKISPDQIDAVLREFESVENACSIGLKDKNGKERPYSLVVASKPINPELLADFCAAKLGAKSRPAAILQVSTLPQTPSGKLDRKAIESYFFDDSKGEG